MLGVILVGVSCGNAHSRLPDAGTPTPDSGGGSNAHACVFDTDTFNSGCTFGP